MAPVCKSTIQQSLKTLIYYSPIVRLLLEIAVDRHTQGFRQLSDNLQGSIEAYSISISHIVPI